MLNGEKTDFKENFKLTVAEVWSTFFAYADEHVLLVQLLPPLEEDLETAQHILNSSFLCYL